ncbi:MAG: CRISPR-associated helicase Cas3' [Eubacteriales bacterium]
MTYIARFLNNDTEVVQTVQEHLIKVSEYCGNFGKEIGLQSTCELCGFLHDGGKYSDAFSRYITQAQFETKQGTYDKWFSKVKKVDHGVYGAKYLFVEFGDATGMRRLTRDIIAEVICYHHGGLCNNLNSENEIPLIKRMASVTEEDLEVVRKRFFEDFPEKKMMELFEKAVLEIGKIIQEYRSNISMGLGFLIKYIYSCLVDADRLDSYCFESGYIEQEVEVERLWEIYTQRLESKLLEFYEKIPNSLLEQKVKDMRETISQECKEAAEKEAGIYTLTVPTGGGKTLASMRFALYHAKKYKKKRIIYIMPYTSIIEQNAEEMRKALGCQEHLLEFHSNVLDDSKNEEYEILGERFNSPIIFTTMVQFLNVLFATGNGNIRKMHQFENAVIIFDEIQALSIKCTALFYQGINFLAKIGNSTCVLCTATQPNYSYINEEFKVKINGELMSHVDQLFENLKRMKVVDMTQQEMTVDEITKFVAKIKEEAQSVLCIMNTVKVVLNIYEEVKAYGLDGVDVYVLTTRMCPAHRKKVIADIKMALKEHRSIICISTQLIEAGVDLSFEKVIRSLANLDSIAQAAGRGNRHGERDISEVYVVKSAEENSSLEVKIGQSHTQNIFCQYKLNPENYQYDLLSPRAIASYYNRFYGDDEVNKNMKYSLKNGGTIYELLVNDTARKKRRKNFELSYTIQFEEARKNFRVIDSMTRTIIVQYNDEAKNAVGILLSNAPVNEKYQVLKTLQKYSISIYQNFYDELSDKKAFIPNKMEGVDILSEEYYISEKGVTGEKEIKIIEF